LSTT
jgi:hypothetical protein